MRHSLVTLLLLFAIAPHIPAAQISTSDSSDGKPPYTQDQLIEILKLHALPREEIESAILKRGISAKLTADIVSSLRGAGAWSELILELSVSYRPVGSPFIEGSRFEGYIPFCIGIDKMQGYELIRLFEIGLDHRAIINLVRAIGVRPPDQGPAPPTPPKWRDVEEVLIYHGATTQEIDAIDVAAAEYRPRSAGFSCEFTKKESPPVTLQMIGSLKIGMSFVEAARILGIQSNSSLLARSNGYSFQTAMWFSPALGPVRALFREGRLVALYAEPEALKPWLSQSPL